LNYRLRRDTFRFRQSFRSYKYTRRRNGGADIIDISPLGISDVIQPAVLPRAFVLQ